jgi:DNA-binding NarL/FixJ family response regulator
MNRQPIRAGLVTRSIPLADGLNALLGAIAQIDEVSIARNYDEALEQIENRQPHLVLIDSDLLGKHPEMLLAKVIALSPATKRVLLVDDVQDVKWIPQYAEAALIKGCPPSAVAAIVTDVLFSKGAAYERNASEE